MSPTLKQHLAAVDAAVVEEAQTLTLTFKARPGHSMTEFESELTAWATATRAVLEHSECYITATLTASEVDLWEW